MLWVGSDFCASLHPGSLARLELLFKFESAPAEFPNPEREILVSIMHEKKQANIQNRKKALILACVGVAGGL